MIYRFNEMELDDQGFKLWRCGEPVAITGKLAEFLLLLVTNRERVVERNEIAERLWPDVTVSNASVATILKEARQLLGDSGTQQRIIRTLRGRGIRWVAPVETLRGRSRVVDSRIGSYDRLVGRRAQLERCDALLADRSGGVVLIEGEAGIGKTRLSEELCRRAQGAGYRIATARCSEIAGAPADWPWRQLVRAMSPSANIESPWSRAPGASQSASQTMDPTARFALFRRIADFARSIATDRPWVLVLDDLHDADPFALALTAFVVDELADRPVVVVGTWREPHLPRNDGRRRWLLDLTRSPRSVQLRLRGLSVEETRALCQDLVPDTPATTADEIHERSAGNPYFVKEIVQALVHEPGPPSSWDTANVHPTSLMEVVQRRLEALSPGTRRALEAASLLGDEFSKALAEVVAGIEPATAIEHWDEAAVAGFIRPVVNEPDAFAFVHAIVRSALEMGMAPGARPQYHRAAVEALESSFPLTRYEWLSRLAHHSRQAVPLVPPCRAISTSCDAARAAARGLAFEEAVTHLEGALALCSGRSVQGREDRARMYLDKGHAHIGAGSYTDARSSYLEAIRLARSAESPVLLTEAALGLGAPMEHVFQSTTDDVLIGVLEESLAVLPPSEPSLRARVVARLALAMHTTEAISARGLEHAATATRLGRELNDPDIELRARLAQFFGHWRLESMHEALTCTRAMLDALERGASPQLATWSLMLHAVCLLTFGHVEEARRLRRQIRVFRSSRMLSASSEGSFNALFALVEGRDFELVEQSTRETRRVLRTIGDPGLADLASVTILFPLRHQQRRSREMVPLLDAASSLSPRSLATRCMLAVALCEAGEVSEARAHYDAIRERLGSPEVDGLSTIAALGFAPDLVRSFDDQDRARALLSWFDRFSGRHVFSGIGYLGPVARHRGVLAAVLGEQTQAAAWFDEALRDAEAIGAQGWRQRLTEEISDLRLPMTG